MDDEREKLRMKDVSNEFASLISSLNLGSEEMPIKEYMQSAGKEIVDAKYIMIELMDLAWVEIHLGLESNNKSKEGNDVDGQPTPIIKLAQVHEYA